MREWLEFRGRDFLEYDVELDRAAFARMREQSGWQGRSCMVGEKCRVVGEKAGEKIVP